MDRPLWQVGAAIAGVVFAATVPEVARASAQPSTAAFRGSASASEVVPPASIELLPEPARSASRPIVVADAEVSAGNPVMAPLKWSGLWYWTMDDGHESACTAQFITEKVILLAAHCVRDRDTGKFYTTTDKNSAFLLQYQNKDFSHAYHAICKATWNDYVVPLHTGEDPDKPETMSEARRQQYADAMRQSWQWDYAFILLDGESITGHYNYRINEHWTGAVSTGYPGAIMGGQVIQQVRGDVLNEHDVIFSQGDEGNEQLLWHGNAQHTQGASGGAWIVHMSSTVSDDTNLIVGLNSYHSDNKPGASFGPFFTDKFKTLLDFTSNGCK